MYNEKIRKAIANYYNGYEEDEQPLLFGPSMAYDNSIIGFTEDGRAVYDYQKMVEELMQEDNCTREDAIDWIDYNTIRALPYANGKGHAPIVINISIEEVMEGYGE